MVNIANRTNKMAMVCIPQRLRDARIATDKTIKEVAELLGISAQALSMFELGRCAVSPEMFFRIKNIYGFPISFYRNNYVYDLNRGTVFFRKFSTATKRKREAALKNAEFVSNNIFRFFDGKVKFPKVDDAFADLKKSIPVQERSNPELWAKLVRRKWGLGSDPIINLIRCVEKRGVIVSVIPLDEKVDGFSYWQNGRPFIFVNKNNSAVRLRMSIAHELCHLFFHEGVEVETDLKRVEDEAKHFAGAFLIPENSICNEMYTTNMDKFIYLKMKWKISITALVKRAYESKVIDDDKQQYLYQQISRKRWKKKEPGDDEISQEKPLMLKQAIELFEEKNIFSKEKMLDAFGLNGSFVEEACSLPAGYFDNDTKLVEIGF